MASLGEHLVSVCLGTRQMETWGAWKHIRRGQLADEPAATGQDTTRCREGGRCGFL